MGEAKSSSEDGAKSKGKDGVKSKEAPSREEQERSNSDLPTELTVGALSSLWNSKSGVTPMIRPSMGRSVKAITQRLQLGPSDSEKEKVQWKRSLIPDFELRLAEQPRHTH